jgi:transcription elongation GreA/GreB family factor
MEAELESLVKEGKITARQSEVLDRLQPGSYCIHKSWGFGSVASWNLALNQIVIDFENKKGHPMQPPYAADTLTPLPAEHIRVLSTTDPAKVRELATSSPADLLRIALKSFGGSATQDVMQSAMKNAIPGEAEAKKVWDAARRILKKDGHFAVPAKKADPWVLRETALSRGEELITAWKSNRQIKSQIAAAENILREKETFASDPSSLAPVINGLDDYARKHRRLNLGESLEALLLRDDIIAAVPGAPAPPEGAPNVPTILKEEQDRLAKIISVLSAARQKRILVEFSKAFGDDAVEHLIALVPLAPGRVAGEIARLLAEMGQDDAVRSTLNKLISDHSLSSDLLLWMCKERKGRFADLMNERILSCLISAMERDLLNEIKATRLQDMLLSDQQLLPDLLQGTETNVVRDLTRKIILTPALDDLNKRSLLARIIKLYPEMHSLVTGDGNYGDSNESAPSEKLVVSWESLEKRKEEFEELVNKKIPENSKDIQVAREYGDLRENFEFKSAKEMQAVLMRRKSELEVDLSRAQGTDFTGADTSTVSIGTWVELRDVADNKVDRYAILGAWDSDPAKGVLSYLTAIGQALLGKAKGDTVVLPMETGTRTVTIESITKYIS